MSVAPAAPRLAFPPRSLVVVGGLPGSGKTTLLERLAEVPGAVVLDSAGATRRWQRLPVPYRALRPLVHLEHHARIALAALAPAARGVVVHETATRAASRPWLRHAARWGALRAEAARGRVTGERWASVRLLDRAAADALTGMAVRAPRRAARSLRPAFPV